MKRLFYNFSMLLLAGMMFSCQNDDATSNELDSSEKGTLEISFKYAGVPESRASVDDDFKKPVTKKVEIGDKVLILSVSNAPTLNVFPAATTIIDAYEVTVAASTSGEPIALIKNIPTTSSHFMVVYDYVEVSTAVSQQALHQETAINGTTLTSLSGKKLSDLKFSLVTNSDEVGARPTDAVYTYSPTDLFSGYLNATPLSDQTITASVDLTRSVSLIRSSMYVSDNGVVENKPVGGMLDWDSEDNYIVIRKSATIIDLLLGMTLPANTSSGVLRNGEFRLDEPTTGYATDAGVAGDAKKVIGDKCFAWQDFVVFPSVNNTKYNILIAMKVADGSTYPAVNAAGTIVPVLGSAEGIKTGFVYFAGQIGAVGASVEVLRNEILSVTAALDSKGLPEPPVPEDYGNIDLTVNLLGWGDVVKADIIL